MKVSNHAFDLLRENTTLEEFVIFSVNTLIYSILFPSDEFITYIVDEINEVTTAYRR